MDASKIRYFAEKRLKSALTVSIGAFSDECTYLALARGPRITIVATSDALCDPIYYQDADSDVTALLWLSDNILIAGYASGNFVTTRITYTYHRVQGEAFGLRAFPNSSIVAMLKGSSRNRLVLASESNVQLWRSTWISRLESGLPRWIFDKQLTLSTNQPVLALSWSYRSPKDLFIVHPQGIMEWDVRHNKQSEIFKRPSNSEILRISWDGRRVILVVHQAECRTFKCLDIFTGIWTHFSAPDLDNQEAKTNDKVEVTFTHDDKLLLLGTSGSERLILWDLTASDQEVLKIIHDWTPGEDATLLMIPGWPMEDCAYFCVYPRVQDNGLGSIGIKDWAARNPCSSFLMQSLHAMRMRLGRSKSSSLLNHTRDISTAMTERRIQRFERVALKDIPSSFLPLYVRGGDISDYVLLINMHMSLAHIPTRHSARFTVEVDVAWQCLLRAGHIKFVDRQSANDVLSPQLISWCLYFLEVVPWETIHSDVDWPDVDHPFLLLPWLLCEHKVMMTLMCLPSNTSNNSPLQKTASAMLRISVQAALLYRTDMSGVFENIEDIFRTLYSVYPKHYVESAITQAADGVTEKQVKALATRLASYVIDKPDNLPIERVLQMITRLSRRSTHIDNLCREADTPRWAAHALRVAAQRPVCRTNEHECTVLVVSASAAYLSWLFASQPQTGKLVQEALKNKLLHALFRCLNYEKRLWATREGALPVTTLLKYLAIRIAACPTTGRKAKVALRRVKMEGKHSEARTIRPSEAVSTQVRSEADDVYVDLWIRWELVVDAIRDPDMEEESCANLQVVHDSWTLAVENMQWLLGLARMLEGMLSEGAGAALIQRANDAHSELPAVDLRMCIVGPLDQCGSSACTAFSGLLRAITNPKRRPSAYRYPISRPDAISDDSEEERWTPLVRRVMSEGSGDDEDDEEEFVGGDALAVMVIWSMKTVVVLLGGLV
ncbi:hypothetical protein BDZ89DRAFT_1034235 [Hymenopellis radicata]|nr:hypothetical protein BDZ89DRAFT_1034235 [Hymenopellis radicata]